MSARGAHGFVLVTVLLLSTVVWSLLSAGLILAHLQHSVAVAARDHRVAQKVAHERSEALRHGVDAGAAALSEAGGDGLLCSWSSEVLAADSDATRLRTSVTYGRAAVVLDATVWHEP